MRRIFSFLLIAVIGLLPYTASATGAHDSHHHSKEPSHQPSSHEHSPVLKEETVEQQTNHQSATIDEDHPFLSTDGLYVQQDSPVMSWVNENAGDPRAKKISDKIGSVPTAQWFGDWNVENVDDYVNNATKGNKLPVLVAYNIPNRDCGLHSAGGAKDMEEYKAWIRQFAKGIDQNHAVVILEPDAISQVNMGDCLSEEQKQTRLDLIKDAVTVLKQDAPKTWVYIDAGNSTWVPADQMVDLLEKAGVKDARGISLNVSNYNTTIDEEAYGKQILSSLKEKYQIDANMIIDTSRNGNGSNGEWCNPPGRKIGDTPKTTNGDELVDAYLWVKRPGESDGNCGIGEGTHAGQFTPELAESLIDGK